MRQDIFTSHSDKIRTMDTIKNVWKKYKYIIDPHTSVAYNGYIDYAAKNSEVSNGAFRGLARAQRQRTCGGNALDRISGEKACGSHRGMGADASKAQHRDMAWLSWGVGSRGHAKGNLVLDKTPDD